VEFLVFQLQAPISAWGETAVGEFRPSANYPSESALLGLLAAALGIRREQEDVHLALRAGYGFAIGVLASGRLLRDYHTAQVPGRVALKNRPHNSRRDELSVSKDELNTILSTRDYRQDASSIVAVQMLEGAPYTLTNLALALSQPYFTLYLGRKACPPTLPLNPQVVTAESALAAIQTYHRALPEHTDEDALELERLVWGNRVASGVTHDLEVIRKDRLLSRQQWQFGDRSEYVALAPQGGH
jgi:CRISPR system Cascade subunit CasD